MEKVGVTKPWLCERSPKWAELRRDSQKRQKTQISTRTETGDTVTAHADRTRVMKELSEKRVTPVASTTRALWSRKRRLHHSPRVAQSLQKQIL